ncbi:zf-CCHC domain-containing protein/UBN2 domain-containing protein [Cephalotus follicularis]|uniref:Zf-CCHC domain-containing protein/UBN2 domain-containing protein n=1 Tax=Cephalotus follicularis TaxID=3775 RepID=A0A1Q3BDL9_CEPFO|nr:zf-CCHC domain-containing protein/UBN2 domain-containing protein [Cephalotus follicularis]
MNSQTRNHDDVSEFKVPFFSGDDFPYWKSHMEIYLKSRDFKNWLSVKNGPHIPMKINDKNECIAKTEDEWDDDDFKKLNIDNKTINILLVSLNKTEYNLVRRCTSAHEVWKLFILTHEGTEQVKNAKLALLNRDYELFKMQPNESIKNLYNRLLDITNALLDLVRFLAKMNLLENCLEEEDYVLFAKQFTKFAKMNKTICFLKKNPNKGEGRKMDPPTCFECNKPGHIKVDCPQLKKKKLFKKKALKA